jgi:DNA-binding transcriptional LysR family regulator
MELRHLNHLIALADERHFARAALRVHLSQPAFSRSIQTLERQAGLRLFDREGGDVRPTAAGDFLIDRARRLLFDARCVDRDLALYRNRELGDTAFGVGPFPAATLLQQVLPALRRAHPHVSLRVEVGNWVQLLERLRKEDIEFFIADARSMSGDRTLDVQPLVRQQGRFYVRQGHPLASGDCDLAQVWAFGVATTRLPAEVKRMLTSLIGAGQDVLASPALECDDVRTLIALTLATDTVLVASDAAVQSELAAGTLRPIVVEGFPDTYIEMGIISLHKRTASPMAQHIIQVFQQQVP